MHSLSAHLVSREVDEELLLGEKRGANALQASEHLGPVVLGLVEHLLHRVDVSHAALELADVTVHGVPFRRVKEACWGWRARGVK